MLLPNQTPPVCRTGGRQPSRVTGADVSPSVPEDWGTQCHNGFLRLRRKVTTFFDTDYACGDRSDTEFTGS